MAQEKCIILIEHEESLRKQIAEAFSAFPCRIVPVTVASDAVVQVAVEGPNIVILSLDLPDGDGIALLREIRTFDETLPIIVMSAHYTKEMLVEVKLANPLDSLMKPVDSERLKRRVTEFLWTSQELEAIEAWAVALGTELEEEEIEEAIPKGAEVLNVNELVSGMKVARVVELNGVVYADKSVVLTAEKIKLLTRMGVEEVCVHIDKQLKKKASEHKIPPLAVPEPTGVRSSEKSHVFAKAKRSQIRVPVSIPAVVSMTGENGSQIDYAGKVVDISAGGGAILTKQKFDKDDEIILNFTLNDQIAFKDVKAVVRYSTHRGTDEFPYRMGIYFTSVTEKFREKLVQQLFKIQLEQRKKEIDKRGGRRLRRK